ncbi:MAG TPA: thioredoxin [Bacteroidales bacterium]
MKKLFLLFGSALAFTLLSCSNITGGEEKTSLSLKTGASEISSSASAAEVEYLTYDTFKEKVWNFEKNPDTWVYEGTVPCVIDFYADWCKPCKMVAPIMDELAVKYDGKVKIYKIDVDKEKQLAAIFGVRSIPSVLFSPMSGKPSMQAGALPKDQYIQIIEDNLLTK